MPADGSGATTTLADAGSAAWSPDGTRVLLAVAPRPDSPDWQIVIANADGSGQRRLADGDSAVWSTDGSRIAFVRYEDAGPSIYVAGAAGGAPERITSGLQPAWSPDGSALAVWRQDTSVRPPSGDGVVPVPEALWIVGIDGGDERQLTPYEVRQVGGGLAWSPDGQLIASDDRLLQTDGTQILRLDRGDTWADRPWSPDGEDLIVVDTDSDQFARVGISLLSVDSGELRSIVPSGDDALSHVTWSPDGRFLAYTAVRWTVDGDIAAMGIRIVPAAGGEVLDLGATDSQFPAWQPAVSVPLD
jgi:Tol biopolymer transport system component